MRLIDADPLLTDRKKRMYYHLPNGDTAIPIIDIEHAPIIDAVPVVRCKDCKYYEPNENPKLCGGCIANNGGWLSYEFCSSGKRKEE